MAALDDLVSILRATVARLQTAETNAAQTVASAEQAVEAAAWFGSERRVTETEALRGTINDGSATLTAARQMVEELLQQAVALQTGQAVSADTTGSPSLDVTSPGSTWSGWDAPGVVDHEKRPKTFTLPDARRKHILDGDDDGSGGHRHGTGRPTKTEFPQRWDDDTVTGHVMSVARSPDHVEMQNNGRWLASGWRDGVEVNAVIEVDGEVCTSFPTEGGAGVVRNPKRQNKGAS